MSGRGRTFLLTKDNGVTTAGAGGGTANQVAYFDSAFQITGEAAFTYNPATNLLTVSDGSAIISKAIAAGSNNYLLTLSNPTTTADVRSGLRMFVNAALDGGATIKTVNDGLGGGDIVFSSINAGTETSYVRLYAAGPSFQPVTDNTVASGGTSNRWSTGYFGTALVIGTTPAAAASEALIRTGNNAYFMARNAANDANAYVVGFSPTNTVDVGGTAFATKIYGSEVVVNETGIDADFRIESDTNANHFVSDAGANGGTGSFGFGVAGASDRFITIDPPARTATANTSYYNVNLINNGALTIPTGTTPEAAVLRLSAHGFALTGAITDAYTQIISAAPTGATRNGALWVAAGDVVVGTTALATNATAGFFWIPTCAGTPTGVPANGQTGARAMVFDTTNNKFWMYDAGWLGVTLT